MKNLLSIAGKFFLILFSVNSFAQAEIPIVIEDFIEQHELLISYRGNDGEIDWESKNDINKKKPVYLVLCFETVKKHCAKSFKIHLISYKIKNYSLYITSSIQI